MQAFHLCLEHVVEGRAQHAAELHLPFGEAADPQVDLVEATTAVVVQAQPIRCVYAGGVQEVQAIRRCTCAAQHQQRSGIAHFRGCLCSHIAGNKGSGVINQISDARMRAVSRDEVDNRHRVFDVLREVGPARVGLEVGEGAVVIELCAGFVERRNAGVAAAGNVERGQVERQAQQVAAHVRHDELVDFVAQITRQAANDVGVGGGKVHPAGNIGLRVEEHREQGLLVRVARADGGQVVFETIHRVGQHRVTKAVNRVRELGHD